jgi:hypothetical protein
MTTEGLESTARRTAERIVSLFKREREGFFQAAVFHGSFAGRQPRNGEALAFYLILVDRERAHPLFSSHRALLAKLGAVAFGNGSDFLVPGVLYILVTTPGDFDKAAQDLHPQIVTLAESYEILYAHDAESRAALEKLLVTVKRQAQRQRTA